MQLILARELAANLASPMFLIDADGMLVFYNEAAEGLIGKPFPELGEITAAEWGKLLEVTTLDGERLRIRETPSGIAYYQHRPAHTALTATAFDGTRRNVEVTAYPLFGTANEMHGVVSIFWELEGK